MKKFKGCIFEAQSLQSASQLQFCLESEISSCALPSSVFPYFISSDRSCRRGANHPIILLGFSLLLLIFGFNFLPLSMLLPSSLPSSLVQPILNYLLLCFSCAWCRLLYSPFSFPGPVYMRALRAASPCSLMRVVQIAPVL